MSVTPIRVVCNNTLQLALTKARRCWAINHYRSLEGKVREAQQTLQLSSLYMGRFVEYGEQEAEHKLSPEQIEYIVDDVLFPKKRQMTAAGNTYREKKISAFEACYNAPDLKAYRGTGWGIINAVSDYMFHAKNKKQRQESIMRSVLRTRSSMMDDVTAFLRSAL